MDWEKSPDALVARFGQIMDRFPDVERRKMFGYPAAFVGGNMVTGLNGLAWIVRIPPEERAELTSAGARTFEPMAGRPMKNYLVLPDTVMDDDDAIASWVERAIAHGQTLPAKGRK